MSTPLHYRLVIRNAADTADDLVISSVGADAGDTNRPYLLDAPTVDGARADLVAGTVDVGAATVRFWDEPVTSSPCDTLDSFPVVSGTLVLDLDPQDLCLFVDGANALPGLVDKSGAGNHPPVPPGAKPTFEKDQLATNRHSVTTFGALGAGAFQFPVPAVLDWTYYVVYQCAAGAGSSAAPTLNGAFLSADTTTQTPEHLDWTVALLADGRFGAEVGTQFLDTSHRVTSAVGGFDDGVPHVFAFTRDSVSGLFALYVDGVQIAVHGGLPGPADAPTHVYVGSPQTSGGTALNIDFGRILCFDAVHDSLEIAAMTEALGAFYGVAGV